jgi:excisionase family DNA binding protein
MKNISPLFYEKADRRRRLPLAEVAERLGIPQRTLRRYALDGTIPGARRFGPRKHWTFEKYQLETWWQNYNAKNEVNGKK